MPTINLIVLQPLTTIKVSGDPWLNGLRLEGVPLPQYVRSDAVKIDIWHIKDYKFIDHI
jgi:hypothetical protein